MKTTRVALVTLGLVLTLADVTLGLGELTQKKEDANGLRNLYDYLKNRITEGGRYSDESEALKWVQQYNEGLRQKRHLVEEASWSYLTNITNQTQAQYDKVNVAVTQWLTKQQKVAKLFDRFAHPKYSSSLFSNTSLIRMLGHIARYSQEPSPKDAQKLKETLELQSQLSTIYSSQKISDDQGEYTLDDLGNILKSAPSFDRVTWAVTSWYDAIGHHDIRNKYTKLVLLENEAARDEGFSDMGQYWRLSHFGEDNLERMVDRLWQKVKPMYQQLHAYIRKVLADKYGDVIDPKGPIPIQLTGNMWGQEWTVPGAVPFQNNTRPSVDEEMKRQNWNITRMYKTAESFFTSLGLEPMTADFWENSMLEKPPGRTVDCHGSAEDFYNDSQFRIKLCTQVSQDDLLTVHHEMGHIEYFMQYRRQPTVYRRGANSAFHEAIGDTIALSVNTPKHLQAIGLINNTRNDNLYEYGGPQYKQEIQFLLDMALRKIAFLPFGLLVDKWRWAVFRGDVDQSNYNAKWWQLVREYQGLVPPSQRDESGFDAGAKFHISHNVPYIRYFLSFIGQFQFHRTLCDVAGHREAIHKCDIYNSKAAGDKLKSMLSIGSSQPWREVMKTFTGSDTFDASAIIDYFRPLQEWLTRENSLSKQKIGWD